MNKKPIAIILGAGGGLGQTLCQQFHESGYLVVGINRTMTQVDNANFELHQANLSDTAETKVVLQNILENFGTPDVVIHNTAQLVIKPFLHTSSDEFNATWQSMNFSFFSAMQTLLPPMVKAGKGTVIVSGATASIRGGAKFAAFASAKFALRGLTQSLAREFQSQGIHIVHVLLDGIIDTPKSRALHSLDPEKMMMPKDIAAQYLALVEQPSSIWTHELDLRPSSESF